MKMATSSPGGKKLKQARLSFGAVTPSPSPRAPAPPPSPSPSPAKRIKLQDPIPLPEPEEPIQLTDEVSEDNPSPDKVLNPYVQLVDIALKRKLKRKRNTTVQLKPKSKSVKKNASDNCASDDVSSKHSETNKTADDKVTVVEADDKSITVNNDSVKNTAETIVIEDSMDANVPAADTECNETVETKSDQDEPSTDDVKDVEMKSDGETSQKNDMEMVTPKRKRSKVNAKQTDSPGNVASSGTPSTPASARKLTPKQIQKKMESTQRQEQREKEKKERDMAKQLEKDEKAKQKQERKEQRQKEREEKERLKEEEKRVKEEKEKQKREMKELDEIRKREKKEAKEEERKKRDEALEEMKRQKEIEKEEIENRKKKTSMAFVSFFVPKEKTSKPKDVAENQSMDDSNHNYLSNFTIKSDMRLAPIVRHKLDEKSKTLVDGYIKNQRSDRDSLYLSDLKSDYSCKTSRKTWPLEELKNDLIIIEDDLPTVDDTKEENLVISDPKHRKTMKPKLYAFSENRRPPYWGTWRRKSSQVNGRRPFAMDKTYLDYTCDSDEEWEEEEPGESVESVAGSDDEEGENEYDVDNDFMVPHGYLSDEEALGEDDNALSPETQKAKLKFLEHEFEDEMKKPTKIKKPRLIGIFWQNSNGNKPDLCPDTIWDFFMQRKIVSSDTEISIQTNNDKENENDSTNKSVKNKHSRKISDDMIPNLIRLIHGNTNNRGFLIKEFQMFLARSPTAEVDGVSPISRDVSKVSIAKKIKELSTWMPCPEDGQMCTKMCWYVEKDVREKHDIHDLTLPNQWSYVLVVPKRRSDAPKKENCKSPPTKSNVEVESSAKKDGKFDIKKFTKKMTADDRKSQFVPPSPQDMKIATPDVSEPIKKRLPLLFSGPRGVSLSESNGKVALSDTNTDNNQENQCNTKNTESKTENSDAKKRIPLLASGPRGKDLLKPVKTNLLTQFIKTASVKYKNSSDSESKTEANDLIVLSD